MTLILDLPKELEEGLTSHAAREGVPVEAYALRLLAEAQGSKRLPQTGKDLVDYWQREGLLGTRPDIADSQLHARTLREKAQHREHA